MAATVIPADQPGHWRPSGLVLAADAVRTRTDPEHGSIVRQLADDLPTVNRSRKGIPLVRQTAPLAHQCHRVQSNASLLDAVSGRVQLALPEPERVLDWPSHPATSKRKASSTEVQADPPSRRPRLLGPKQWDVPHRDSSHRSRRSSCDGRTCLRWCSPGCIDSARNRRRDGAHLTRRSESLCSARWGCRTIRRSRTLRRDLWPWLLRFRSHRPWLQRRLVICWQRRLLATPSAAIEQRPAQSSPTVPRTPPRKRSRWMLAVRAQHSSASRPMDRQS